MLVPNRSRFDGAAAVALFAAIGLTASGAIADPEAVKAVQTATEKYKDVQAALADGYVPDPAGLCVDAALEGLPAEWGAMGIHYLRPDLLQITETEPRVNGSGVHTDFQKPSILLYEPQADGSLKLVGAENLVFEKAWTEAGNAEPPTFAGRTWDHMVDDPSTPSDEAHGFAPHYDQHVWFVGSPSDALNPFNPAVTCKHHTIKAEHKH